jgi:hypothetical protein
MRARSLTEISPADLPTELAVGFTRIRVGVDTRRPTVESAEKCAEFRARVREEAQQEVEHGVMALRHEGPG